MRFFFTLLFFRQRAILPKSATTHFFGVHDGFLKGKSNLWCVTFLKASL